MIIMFQMWVKMSKVNNMCEFLPMIFCLDLLFIDSIHVCVAV